MPELTTPQGDEILDIGQAAKLANKSVSTMYWLRGTGQGPRSGKLGRRLVYKRSDVLAWIETAFEACSEGVKARDKANELNEIARPKGLIVTFEASLGAAGYKFMVRREGAPANSALPFGTAEEVEEYLAEFPDRQDGTDGISDGSAP